METATFAAGCFWGVEATFAKVKGVVETAVGYEGGTMDQPSYEDVCTDETGHAEVVQLRFDPALVSFDQLLDLFFKMHDPTTRDRQGPDHGTQYRSAVFYHGEAQKAAAAKAIERAQPRFKRPIVTRLEPAATFWRAEDYHQRYLEKRGMDNCHLPNAGEH
jgi:peptide-methionine (S)-S-oxide reductase